MQSTKLTISLAMVVSLLSHGPAVALNEIVVADSIDWRVASADAIIRVRVDEVTTEQGDHGLITEVASFFVLDVLKGAAPESLDVSVDLYTNKGWEAFDRPSRWKRDNVELLLFLKDGKVNNTLRLDGERSHGQGHRAFKLDMTVCDTRNSVLAALFSALQFEEENGTPKRSVQIDVPPDAEFWSELYGGSSVLLTVPVDRRLERAMESWAESNSSALDGKYMKEQIPRIREQIKSAK